MALPFFFGIYESMKLISLALTLVLLSSCSSIRMQYYTEIKTTEGKTAKFRYRQSYDVSPHDTLCGLTAIFLGGACWFYLVMPTVNQQQAIREDGERELSKQLKGGKYEPVRAGASQAGWGTVEPEALLVFEDSNN